jgi:uncharacterized protein
MDRGSVYNPSEFTSLPQRTITAPAAGRHRRGNFDTALKFHLQAPGSNLVTGMGVGWIRVGAQEYRENIVLTGDRVATGFAPQGFDALAESDFEHLLQGAPEIVLLGTGETQRFLHPRVTAPLHRARVGLEVMDTRAACRTYNILVAEGRNVTAALIVT